MSTPPHGLAALDLGGVKVDEVLHAGEKSVLARGRADGRPVMIKALRSDEELWRSTFAREIQLYRVFATHPPPAELLSRPVGGDRLGG